MRSEARRRRAWDGTGVRFLKNELAEGEQEKAKGQGKSWQTKQAAPEAG